MHGAFGENGEPEIEATTTTFLPLSQTFRQWADPWSRLGVWVSLWDIGGQCLDRTSNAAPLFDLLMRSSPAAARKLSHISQLASEGRRMDAYLDNTRCIRMIALPLPWRSRILGALVACSLQPPWRDEETLARFCGTHHLDRRAVEPILASTPCHDEFTLCAYADILSRQVDSLTLQTSGQEDIDGLSCHLANAYEQLNALYRVGSGMMVSRRPTSFFESVCSELLEATQVESFVAVLVTPERANEEIELVTVGPCPASREDCLRLYHQSRTAGRNLGSALVINQVARHQDHAWAADWLRQYIFFDLDRNGQDFGGMLALNHRANDDFGSEEIQFIKAMAERCSVFLENARLYNDLEELFMGMLHAMVSSIDAKDPYTCGHSQRVAWLSRYIAGLAGTPEADCQRIYLAGLLHDIGKIGISEMVLCKKGELDPKEYEEMKRHPAIGANIVRNVKQAADLLPGILYHHERLDGKGYPDGLSGADVPFLGRVIGLADGFDAMTTSRTYRRALPLELAAAELRRCAGTQFDPGICELFLNQNLYEVVREMDRSCRADRDLTQECAT